MGELTVGTTNEIANIVEKQGLDNIIKPLIREIYLFDTFVAGTVYLKDKSVLDKTAVGDKLILQREKNKFDENAIVILTEAHGKLGYIPEKDNIIFSRLMDSGKLLIARISNITQKGSFTQIGIGIYLVDF